MSMPSSSGGGQQQQQKVAKSAVQSSLQLLEVHPWLAEQAEWVRVLQRYYKGRE
jgi:hypothetical protein